MEEAPERKPPVRVERLVTESVLPRVVAPLTESDDDAESGPATLRLAATDEEAELMYPPVRTARPETLAVDETESGPETESWAFTVDEAVERKPLSVVRPANVLVPNTFSVPETEVLPN